MDTVEDVRMIALPRFRRTDIWSLRVGDVIRYRALHQSRTGFIARLGGRGRIETLSRHAATEREEAPHVEGTLRDKHGIVQGFNLTEQQRVYRKAAARTPIQPSERLRTQQSAGSKSRDAGNAFQ
jgi:hypothetical protein